VVLLRRLSQLGGLLTFGAFSLFSCRRQYPFEKVPLSPGQLEVVRISETPTLAIDRIRFWSGEMGQPRFFLALIAKRAPAAPPVFILNHGWWDRPEDLLEHLHVDTVYASMLERGQVRPAIVVIPDVRFPNFYRAASARIPYPNYLTLIPEEVAGVVSKHYNIPFERERWGIGGFSFGGYLSLDVGRRYPGRFSTVSIVSGLVDSQWTFWPKEPPPPGAVDERGRGRHTVIVPGPIPRLLLACGLNDRQFAPMQQLDLKFKELDIPHQWSTAPGAHTWKYWSSVLPEMLRFHLGVEQPAK
jgi:enterochelin esterase-like enzyme